MSCQSYAAEDERYPFEDRDCHVLAGYEDAKNGSDDWKQDGAV